MTFLLQIICTLLLFISILVWIGFSHVSDRLDDILKELRKDENTWYSDL